MYIYIYIYIYIKAVMFVVTALRSSLTARRRETCFAYRLPAHDNKYGSSGNNTNDNNNNNNNNNSN